MSTTIEFISANGKFNMLRTFEDKAVAEGYIHNVRKQGGYWTVDGKDEVYIPWHSILHVRMREYEGQ